MSHKVLDAMVAHIIGFVLQNLPALLFVVALLVAAARGRHGPVAERFLSWILLLPIGITGLWAGSHLLSRYGCETHWMGSEPVPI